MYIKTERFYIKAIELDLVCIAAIVFKQVCFWITRAVPRNLLETRFARARILLGSMYATLMYGRIKNSHMFEYRDPNFIWAARICVFSLCPHVHYNSHQGICKRKDKDFKYSCRQSRSLEITNQVVSFGWWLRHLLQLSSDLDWILVQYSGLSLVILCEV